MELGDLYRQVVRSLSDGILVLDLDGTIRYANQSCAALVRVAPDELAGRHMHDFLDADGRVHSQAFLDQAARGQLLADEVDTLLIAADGTPVWVRLKQTGLFEGDRVVGVILRLTDNIETKLLLDELTASRGTLEQAEQIARLGSWRWDLRTGDVHGSEGLVELFGEFTSSLLSRDIAKLQSITHPEDHDRLVDAITTLVDGTKPRVDIELRQRGESGWMWMRMRALAAYDRDGETIAISGTHQDITRARATEDELQDQVTQNSLMQAIASAANEATTLDEVLVHAQTMVVLHDDWERGRAFLPVADGTDVEPRYYSDEDEQADRERPDVAARELATARRCLELREAVWDDDVRLTIAAPIMLGDEVVAVVTITSFPPLYRHDMIRGLVEQAAVQLARVAERERTARELAEARDRALEASRHKSEFLATMSHEIRTPLNGVLGLTELLARTPLDAQQRHLASGIAVSGRSLLGIINDILDFSKIEAGRLDVESVDLEVRDVLEQVTGVLAESARAKGLDLQVSCSPEVPEMLSGDPTRLAQVITNLGSNAVKFTSRGSVSIRATSTPGDDGTTLLRVEVRDTGVGIPEQQRLHIFKPFAQADTSTTRRFGGTGLGLAISAEIVEAFHGEIGVDSTLGEGSTFWFTARLGRPTGARRDARLRRTREQLGRTRVLVVDNDLQNRLILREQLGWWHVTSTGVASAVEARTALVAAREAGDPYDVVLLDLAMPDEDGIDIARSLHLDPRFVHVPLLLLSSAYLPLTDDLRGIGITACLTKPVQAAQLREALVRTVVGEEAGAIEPLPAAASDAARGKLVLVVEDNPVNQVVARGLLSSMGYDVDTADDGAEAVELTEVTAYDAVLMDLQMPRLDGYAATRAIREREAATGTRRTPVLAMTAAAIAGEREKCLAAGMDDFITKPVAPATLAAALARWTGSTDGDGEGGGTVQETSAPDDVPDPADGNLDIERLELLRELSPEDTAYLDRVIGGFLGRRADALDRIRAAVDDDDPARLAAEAHGVKGSALNIGLPVVGGLAGDLEHLGRAGGTAGADDLLLRFEAALQDAEEGLLAYQEWYRSLTGGA
ncbi:PAS domain-containing hybrid sensor histidine kinase/response regulator [Nocardioides zeae]|uniref:Circadian input-output histidine kinase CikA n=1 Tax=Nocardioides zeae TaxID=1457234 RepID=A0AAJ1TXB3_9ACTN|nr:PAS domain-containing hybrid sensor histidine kinase/response regulator [Nocardioides zeae]MDQ1103484.1 PAS domain S-box-containing protein [Nocardioides zeae]